MLKRVLSYWLPVIVYCVFIYTFSAQPSVPTGGHDKIAHLGAYAVLGFLVVRLQSQYTSRLPLLILTSILLSTFFGVTDEFHQSFVPGRNSSGWDLLADGIGSILGVCAYVLLRRLPRSTASSS